MATLNRVEAAAAERALPPEPDTARPPPPEVARLRILPTAKMVQQQVAELDACLGTTLHSIHNGSAAAAGAPASDEVMERSASKAAGSAMSAAAKLRLMHRTAVRSVQ